MSANDHLSPDQFGDAGHATGPYVRGDESEAAIRHGVAWDKHHGVDGWGRKLMQPYDGHGAWSCNNYDCVEHPSHLYDMYRTDQPKVQGMPGWMQHENDPQRDTKREVDKFFHESGLGEDGEYLLNQQHQGPSGR